MVKLLIEQHGKAVGLINTDIYVKQRVKESNVNVNSFMLIICIIPNTTFLLKYPKQKH